MEFCCNSHGHGQAIGDAYHMNHRRISFFKLFPSRDAPLKMPTWSDWCREKAAPGQILEHCLAVNLTHLHQSVHVRKSVVMTAILRTRNDYFPPDQWADYPMKVKILTRINDTSLPEVLLVTYLFWVSEKFCLFFAEEIKRFFPQWDLPSKIVDLSSFVHEWMPRWLHYPEFFYWFGQTCMIGPLAALPDELSIRVVKSQPLPVRISLQAILAWSVCCVSARTTRSLATPTGARYPDCAPFLLEHSNRLPSNVL